MDVTDLVRRLLRRRLAVLLVVVLALAGAGVSWLRATPERQTAVAVVIVPPVLGTSVSDKNPLLNLDNNLAQLATVLALALQSAAVSDALHAEGANGTFTISTITGDNPSFAQLSPQLVITVTSTTAADARQTGNAIARQARKQLDILQEQARVPESAQARLVEAVSPTEGVPAGNSRLRAAGSIGLAVIVFGLIVVLLFDEVSARRRTRKAAATTVEEPAGEAAEPVEQPSANGHTNGHASAAEHDFVADFHVRNGTWPGEVQDDGTAEFIPEPPDPTPERINELIAARARSISTGALRSR